MGEYKRFFRLGLGRSRDLQQELDQEIETHIALRVEDLVAGGMSPDAAREEALQRFGDLQSARSDLYSSARRREGRFRLRALVDDVRCDLRLSLRQARRVPGYSAVAVAIFAVAIGLTTSMFTVVDHVLLRPLPFPDPEQLVALESVQENGEPLYLVSMANWVDWHGGNSTLTSSAIYRTQRVTVGIGDEVLRAEVTTVAGGFFETIRPRMDTGRPFSEQDAEQEAPVVVLSHAFASRTFAGAPPVDALLLVDGQERRVIGVTARDGQIPDGAELWIPRRARPGSGGLRNNINWRSVARIADGVDASVVEAELSTIADNIRRADPEAVYSYGVSVRPLHAAVAGGAGEYLSLLMAAVLLVLLVACANLAGLSLARGRDRARALGVRLALGAGRKRLTRQLLTEHLMLALVGGTLGLVLAWLAGGVAIDQLGGTLPRASEIRLDYRIAAASFLATLAAGLVAGIVPALRASTGVNLSGLVGGRGSIGGGRGLPGATLVATEIALALILLINGRLLVRSFRAIVDRDLGFRSEAVVTA